MRLAAHLERIAVPRRGVEGANPGRHLIQELVGEFIVQVITLCVPDAPQIVGNRPVENLDQARYCLELRLMRRAGIAIPRPCIEHAPQGNRQVLDEHRLGQVTVDAGVEGALPVLGHCVGGQRNDWRAPLVTLVLSNDPCRLVAAHAGHLRIDQDR